MFFKFKYYHLCSLNILFMSWKWSFGGREIILLAFYTHFHRSWWRSFSFKANILFCSVCLFDFTYVFVLSFALVFSLSVFSHSSLFQEVLVGNSEGSLNGQKNCWYLKYDCCFIKEIGVNPVFYNEVTVSNSRQTMMV